MRAQRQNKNLTEEAVAEELGLDLADYRRLEAGGDQRLESAADLIARFSDLVDGQVNQLFYPCGLPLREVKSFEVSTL